MQRDIKASDIAIIGMSCRFPGADNAAQFWKMLADGMSMFSEIPAERFEQHDFGGIIQRYGSFLNQPFHFDNTCFNMSEEEALAMDPQQRIMLELALELRNNAGLPVFENRQVGVYIGANQRGYIEGVNAGYYRNQLRQHIIESAEMQQLADAPRKALDALLEKLFTPPGLHQSSITGNITNMIACRISHEFNLFGPSLTIDTACSSSLVAMHMACEALRGSECDLAMAGGVNMNLTPSIFRFMEKAQVISASGRCIPFSADSDGILLGEGAGLVLLKRLEEAISDSDRVLAVIRGSGINNDGRTIGVMAPSWKGQHRLLESVYSRNGYDKRNISYIEAHGTSTRIGDSLEIGVLMDFFSGLSRTVSVGSVKSNIGHLLGASGIAGVIKAVMALNKKKLPPSLFNGGVNPKWKLADKGFRIQDRLDEWHAVDGVHAAGVSAFGFGGTNAHIILEAPSHELSKNGRLPLPTHFNRKRFAYDLFPGVEKKAPVGLPMYAIRWRETAVPNAMPGFNPDHWIVFQSGENTEIGDGLLYPGASYIQVRDAEMYSRIDDQTCTLNYSNQNHIRWFFEGLHADMSYGILYFPTENAAEDGEASIREALFLKRMVAYVRKIDRIALFCITRNAFCVRMDEGEVETETEAEAMAVDVTASSPHQRMMATIAMAAFHENSSFMGCVTDIGDDTSAGYDKPGKLLEEVLKIRFDGPVIHRKGRFYVPELRQLSNGRRGKIVPGGLYCILGGSSGIGAEMAVYLHNAYSARVVVCGTRNASDLPHLLKTLNSGRFDYFVADVTHAEDVAAFVDHTYTTYGIPDGVIFCAGTIRYGSVAGAADVGFEETLRTKIVGVANLARALSGRKAGLVYLVSSVSGLAAGWAAGMPAYAAANAYLDAAAAWFSSPETPWMSVSWTLWKDTGMSKGVAHKGENNLSPIAADQALMLFDRSVTAGLSHIVLIDPGDAGKFSSAWMYNNISGSTTHAVVKQPAPNQNKVPDNKHAPVEIHNEIETDILTQTQPETSAVPVLSEIREFLLKLVAEATEADAGSIDEEESFSMLGLDSIGALDTVAMIEQQYKVSLSPTLLFENDTIAKLSAYLARLTSNESEELLPEGSIRLIGLSRTQRAFFINHHLHHDAPCNTQIRCDFGRQFDVSLLRRAWAEIVGRHESLRLSFRLAEDGPVQQLHPEGEMSFFYTDLTGREDVAAEIRRLESTFLNKRYDIERMPLFDLCYLSLPDAYSVILFNAHHIITDAWSVAILLKELVIVYNEMESGLYETESYQLASYTDYMEQLLLPAEQSGKSLAGHGSNLQLNTPLILPVEEFGSNHEMGSVHVAQASNNIYGAKSFTTHRQQFDGLSTTRLDRAARVNGLNLFDLLAAAYYSALQITSGKDEQQLRIASANRDHHFTHVGNLTGCFADSLILGLNLAKGLSWQEVARKVRLIMKESVQVSASTVALADLSPHGMSYFNLDYFLKGFEGKGLDVSSSVALPFSEISLICLKVRGALQISWNFPSNVIPDATINDLSSHFTDFLSGILTADEAGNNQFVATSDVNDDQAGSSAMDIPDDCHVVMPSKILYEDLPLLHDKVFAACERYADRKCIVDRHRIFTFADVKAAAMSVASGIVRSGYDSDEAIGILAYPGAESVTGILGILASGCAYIPIDPDWPPGRIADIIDHSGIRCLLCSIEQFENLRSSMARPAGLTQIFLLHGELGDIEDSDADADCWEACSISAFKMQSGLSAPELTRQPKPGSLAYIMYTSGTTGKPKGVMVSHRAVEIFLSWVAEAFSIGSDDRFILTSSLGFGGSVRQIFSTLLAGGELHPIGRFDFKDPESLLRFMDHRKITLLNTVPSVLQSICSFVEQKDTDAVLPALVSLRLVLIGGEALQGQLIRRWRIVFGNNLRMVNLYGSTETLVNATFFDIPDYDVYPDVVPVGIIRDGVGVLLLNGQGNQCKPGEKGEMLVGGPGIARGYYHDIEQTEAKFVSMIPPDTGPLGNSGITYYRTGDLAVCDESGIFHFLGRNDDQVQLYGNRIEPAEIEAVIMSSQLVRQVAVIDAREGERHWLVAIVVKSEKHTGITDVDIRNLVLEKLPAYMVPQQVEFMEKIPMTHAGKTDRNALRMIFAGISSDDGSAINMAVGKETSGTGVCQHGSIGQDDFLQHVQCAVKLQNTGDSTGNHVPLASEKTLRLVADIWRRVLHVEDPGPDQDFFSLGGDSIQALEVLQQLRKAFVQAPKPLDLFRNRTIRSLARHLDALNGVGLHGAGKETSASSNTNVVVNSGTQPGSFPLSNSQRGFYMLYKLQPTDSSNLVAAIPVRGSVDTGLLKEAILYLIGRHPALRASFRQNGSDVVQEISQEISLDEAFQAIDGMDGHEISATESGKSAEISCYDQFRTIRFDLAQAPLFRIALITENPDNHVLLLCMHHIIGDAWSLQVITGELLQVYAQLRGGLVPGLPALRLAFSDFVRAEVESARHESPDREGQLKNYWMSVFSSLPRDGLLKGFSEGAHSDDDVVMVIPGDGRMRLREVCAGQGISLFQLLFAAYAGALSETLNVKKLLIQVSVSGRELPLSGIEQTVGCFAKSIPIVTDNGHDDLIAASRSVAESYLRAAAHQDILPATLIRAYLDSGAGSMESFFRFFISYMDFSSFEHAGEAPFALDWEQSRFSYNAGTAGCALMLGIRVTDSIQLSFNGLSDHSLRTEIKKAMESRLGKLLHQLHPGALIASQSRAEKPVIDAALIAYFPAISDFVGLMGPGSGGAQGKVRELIRKLMPKRQAAMLETETTATGRSGLVFLPYFADELAAIPKGELLGSIGQAIQVCVNQGASSVSLAGNLPALTNYGYDVIAMKKNAEEPVIWPVITTGHSCTVVAVVKTLQKVLEKLQLNMAHLTLGIAGFGSIGQASLHLLLQEIGKPRGLIIADLASQMHALRMPIEKLSHRYGGPIEVVEVERNIPDALYRADLIIGATTNGRVMEVDKLRAGTILLDDSFPHIIDPAMAIQRMKKQRDVLIVGAGKISMGEKKRQLMLPAIPRALIERTTAKLGDLGMPGCRAESLLISQDRELPPTIGLVTDEGARMYWEKASLLQMEAVDLHLQGYVIEDQLIENVRHINSMR